MKLLFLVSGNYIFGAEKVTLDVIQGLTSRGANIAAVVSGWTDGQFGAKLDELHVPYQKMKLGWYYLTKPLWSLDSLLHYPAAFIQFAFRSKEYKKPIVYVTSYRHILLLWPLLKKNVIYHVHDANSDSKQSRLLLKFSSKKVKKYIAISSYIQDDLILCGIAPHKIEIIHNGTEIYPFQKESRFNDVITFGIVGQIIERKGHADIIEAFRFISQRYSNVRLTIVGSGNEEQIKSLKDQIAHYGLNEKVTWRSFQTSIQAIYENIDIVVAPTRTPEPFGLIVTEANMLGMPVIATNTGGFKETVQDGYNGFLAEPCNPVALAEKMVLFCQNRTLIQEMGQNGRRHVEAHFSKDAMINKIQNLINSL